MNANHNMDEPDGDQTRGVFWKRALWFAIPSWFMFGVLFVLFVLIGHKTMTKHERKPLVSTMG